MPELPEVEHAASCLRRWLSGRTIVRARASGSRIFRGGAPGDFESALAGRRLERVWRRGKHLLVELDEGVGIAGHLGMSGKWVRREAGEGKKRTVPRHSHARLWLDDGSALHYVDPRQFGRLAVHRGVALAELPEIRALGPDALTDGVDPGALHAALAKSSRPVKVALLDQAILAGVGNIYATEALFRSGIHPARPSRSLSRVEVERLAAGVKDSLDAALRDIGEGVIAYLSEGRSARNHFLIYDRAGEPCPRCGQPLEKLTIGGRTSAFCARCQR